MKNINNISEFDFKLLKSYKGFRSFDEFYKWLVASGYILTRFVAFGIYIVYLSMINDIIIDNLEITFERGCH